MKPKSWKGFISKCLTYPLHFWLRAKHSKKDSLDEFFLRYPTFKYDRNKPLNEQFRDLCDKFGWRKDANGRYPKAQRDAQAAYRIASTQTFNFCFGEDVNDNDAWGKLCSQLGVVPLPDKIEDRRKIVTGTHVNLVDLLDSRRSGRPLQKFETVEELRDYTVETGKYFPKEEAYAGQLLQWLLREIHNQYHGSRGKGKGGRGRKCDGGKKRDGGRKRDGGKNHT